CRCIRTVAAAHRRLPNLRLGRTGQVLEALIPAVIEQRVPGADEVLQVPLHPDRGRRAPPAAELAPGPHRPGAGSLDPGG
ncbi:hypothetical protein GR254_24860, partial [Mycobacterium tuberculosis]|nr:hypothetical protein [Mycobacterium tuberculosis]